MKKLSVIIPCFNEEEAVPLFYDAFLKETEGMDVEFTDTLPVGFKCNCSKDRVEKALIGVGEKNLKEMIADGEPVELNCHFCSKKYSFSIEELQQMLKRAK